MASPCRADAPGYSHVYSMNDGPEMTLQESPAGLQPCPAGLLVEQMSLMQPQFGTPHWSPQLPVPVRTQMGVLVRTVAHTWLLGGDAKK
jgi:hypothetical protein